MHRNKRSVLTAVAIAGSIAAILIVGYELKLFDMLAGVFSLEKGGKKVARVSHKALIYMMRSSDPEEVFFDEMKRLGWTFFDSYGRGYLFTKNGEEILATKSRCFGRYTVFEIHNEKYFNDMNDES